MDGFVILQYMEAETDKTLLLHQLKSYLVFLKSLGVQDIPMSGTLGGRRMSPPLAPKPPHSKPLTQNKVVATNTISTPIRAVLNTSQQLVDIRDELGDCQRCKLCETRKTIVFGSGNSNADLVFVGEGPGADEDEQGLPFVGRAGKKLTEIIEKGMLLNREQDTYICNIVKCRPPGNRDPEKEEIEACKPFLVKQLQAIQPKVIVALGKPAASTLLGRSVPITKERGTWHEFEGIKLMLTFHPAYLLRFYTLENRKAVMDDMKKVLEVLNT